MNRTDFGEFIVVHKCANPVCSATFHRLSDGRVFVIEAAVNHQMRQVRYYWLCNKCSHTMTLVAEKKGEIRVASARSTSAVW